MTNQIQLARLIIDTVAKSMGVPPHRITQRTQDPAVSRARNVAILAVVSQAKITKGQYQDLFGRNPASLFNAMKMSIEMDMDDPYFNRQYRLAVEDVKRAMARALREDGQ